MAVSQVYEACNDPILHLKLFWLANEVSNFCAAFLPNISCILDEGFKDWMSWSACTSTPRTRTGCSRSRARTCENRREGCKGARNETEPCQRNQCPGGR